MPIANQARKCPITIDNTKVAGSANHTNFPVLLTKDNLPAEIFDADGSFPANADGGDIRITSDAAGTTELAREIVEFTRDNDPANGTCQIWVKVPDLSYNSDTTIYIWYSDAGSSDYAVGDTYGRNAVWSDYQRVYHLESSSTDSTGNEDGTDTSIDYTTGKVQNSAAFNAVGDKIQLGEVQSAATIANMTLQAWLKSATTSNATIASKRTNAAGTGIWLWGINGSTGKIVFWDYDGTVFGFATNALSTSDSIDDTFHMLHFVKSGGTNGAYFLDGSADGTKTKTSDFAYGTTTENVAIGNDTTSTVNLDGEIDEFRLRHSALSSDWISTEYNNQNAPATFASAGAAQDSSETGSNALLFASNF